MRLLAPKTVSLDTVDPISTRDIVEYSKRLDGKYTKQEENDDVRMLQLEREILARSLQILPQNLSAPSFHFDYSRIQSLLRSPMDSDALQAAISLFDTATRERYNLGGNKFPLNAIARDPVFIGEGAYGSSYKLSSGSTENTFVLKVEIKRSIDFLTHEVFIGRMGTNNLRAYTPIYTAVVGGALCLDKYDVNASEKVSWCKASGSKMVALYEFASGVKLRDLIPTIDPVDLWKIMLILAVGLQIGYETIGFTHGDLHGENVMVETLETPIAVAVGTKFVQTRYIPRLIDYGMSRIVFQGRVFCPKKYSYQDILPTRPNALRDVYRLIVQCLGKYGSKSKRDDILALGTQMLRFISPRDEVGDTIRRFLLARTYPYLPVSVGESKNLWGFIEFIARLYPAELLTETRLTVPKYSCGNVGRAACFNLSSLSPVPPSPKRSYRKTLYKILEDYNKIKKSSVLRQGLDNYIDNMRQEIDSARESKDRERLLLLQQLANAYEDIDTAVSIQNILVSLDRPVDYTLCTERGRSPTVRGNTVSCTGDWNLLGEKSPRELCCYKRLSKDKQLNQPFTYQRTEAREEVEEPEEATTTTTKRPTLLRWEQVPDVEKGEIERRLRRHLDGNVIEELRKVDLVDMLRSVGLSYAGNKADLVSILRRILD